MTSDGITNGTAASLARADEIQDLLQSLLGEIVPFVRAADNDFDHNDNHDDGAPAKGPALHRDADAAPVTRTALGEQHSPSELRALLEEQLRLPSEGLGKDGLLEVVRGVLLYSVNTFAPGFLDKLYGSTNAVGLASELLLATLNTNVHVYTVSPVLTLVERATATRLAALFGLRGPHAGGISQPGGSASNASSIVVARNALFPATKQHGNGGYRFALFTSAHGHYSVEKAAQMFGLGSDAVVPVAVDGAGRMRPDALEAAVADARRAGRTPFYVNATAGTTVLGSFDPLDALADVCARHGLWLHVDGSWGGSVVFSERLAFGGGEGPGGGRLRGVQRADSVAVTPHKMLGVPMTCSFLLGRDMRLFHKAMTLPAGYLFHGDGDGDGGEAGEPGWDDMHDLADLTPQCGRRGDSLKMFLSWTYYGAEHYRDLVERAFETAAYLFDVLEGHPSFVLVSQRPLPCLQVCYYYSKGGTLSDEPAQNSATTASIARRLVSQGFLVDYAPGERGRFFRVVVNGQTTRQTLLRLVEATDQIGRALHGG